MTNGNNDQMSVKQVAGAAANVAVIVAQTVGKINDFSQQANQFIVSMMSSSLQHALTGSIAGMLGSAAQGLGQIGSGVAYGAKGANDLSKIKELNTLDQGKENMLAPLKDRQDAQMENLGGANGSQVEGDLADPNKRADQRALLDTTNSQISSVEEKFKGEQNKIDTKYQANDSKMQSKINTAMGLGAIGNAVGSMMQNVHKSIGDTTQAMVSNMQSTYQNANKTAADLTQSASQLYVALTR